jgi:hypothetical protein
MVLFWTDSRKGLGRPTYSPIFPVLRILIYSLFPSILATRTYHIPYRHGINGKGKVEEREGEGNEMKWKQETGWTVDSFFLFSIYFFLSMFLVLFYLYLFFYNLRYKRDDLT